MLLLTRIAAPAAGSAFKSRWVQHQDQRHCIAGIAMRPPVAMQIASSERLLGRCQLTCTNSVEYQQINQQEAACLGQLYIHLSSFLHAQMKT